VRTSYLTVLETSKILPVFKKKKKVITQINVYISTTGTGMILPH